jgi:RNA polymerase sigma factor (sigma-70 family)
MSNELLVVRCQLGERDALVELVRAWHTPVWTYIRRMIGPGPADDVAQDVWLAVLRGLPRLREPDRFTPWLFTIARRAVTNQLRAEYARPEVSSDYEPIEPDASELLADRAELEAGLASLPAREREILVLFYQEDLSLDTCAEICEIPIGTAKSRLSRARRMLREALTKKGYQR